jgi:glutathione peroxidase
MLRSLLVAFTIFGASINAMQTQAANADKNVLNNTVKNIEGQSVELSKYEGKVVLIVNVASRCGHTPQYTKLQEIFDKYKEKGFVVLGFPCNQFGSQEPGSNEEIQKFCSSKYKVTFDLFDKVEVNGADAAPLYKQLTALDAKPKGTGAVKWNFEKFVLNRKGEVIGRFDPKVTPDNADLVAMIEKALAE